jgi:hypothetical protein
MANASGTVQTAENWAKTAENWAKTAENWAKTWTETRKLKTGENTWNVSRKRPTRPERCKQLKTGRKRENG